MSKSTLLVTWVASHSCDHCTEFTEEWEALCAKYQSNKITFNIVYIDDNPSFVQEHDIENVPSFLFSRGGRYYDTCVIGPDVEQIIARMQELTR